jgi:hypothetical protein
MLRKEIRQVALDLVGGQFIRNPAFEKISQVLIHVALTKDL